jgi:hypothetical protein
MSVGKSVKAAVDFYNRCKSVEETATFMLYDKNGAVEVKVTRKMKREDDKCEEL